MNIIKQIYKILLVLTILLPLCASNSFSTPPTPRHSLSVEMISQSEVGNQADLLVVLRFFHPRLLECKSVTMTVETTGGATVSGAKSCVITLVDKAEPESHNIGIPDRSVFDTVITVSTIPNDTSTLNIIFSGCVYDINSGTYYIVSTGDTLETYYSRLPNVWIGDTLIEWRDDKPVRTVDPQGANRIRQIKLDSDSARFTFDLTNPKHFEIFKEVESLIKPDRPMTEPGIYTIQLSLRDYNHAIMEGCIGWPEGQKPDSLGQSQDLPN